MAQNITWLLLDNPDVSTNEAWHEECTVLQAIYDEDIQFVTPSSCQVLVRIQQPVAELLLTMHCTAGYPDHAPLLLTVQTMGSASIATNALGALTAAAASAAVQAMGDMQCHAVIEALIGAAEKLQGSRDPWLAVTGFVDPFSDIATKDVVSNEDAEKTGRRSTHTPAPVWSDADMDAESRRLMDEAAQFAHTAQGKQWARQRAGLPAAGMRAAVLQAVAANCVTVVCGATGCGKSTQVPQYVLEDAIEHGRGGRCNVIVTQPRRISAIGLASRVAQGTCGVVYTKTAVNPATHLCPFATERHEALGTAVGYSVRLESKASKHTRLLYCTTGLCGDVLIGCARSTHLIFPTQAYC